MVQLIKGVVDTQKNSYRSIGQVSAGDDLELELEVKMNGQPIEFINPECELLIKKSDNNKVRQTKDIIYQDGKFKIKVDEQGVTYPGIVSNQLVINDEGRVSTCLFYFNVGASLEREVLQSISKVETLEQLDEYVVTAFSNLDEYETRLTELDGTMKTTNEEITVNESERKVNESERKTNETLRIENEKERVKKENERSEAEIDRKESELDRIKNENARRIAENTRIARENARENAEVNRNAIFEENEVIRNEAEKLREKAEAKRKENFSNLESLNEKLNEAEAERVRAEGNRESKETERQLAESEREKAEANRENTYTNFNDAEVDRRNNENARIQAENLRVQAESIRSERFETAQSTRETKFEESQNTRDELFKASETARATEEIAREKAESIREGNEAIRVNSESLRESAENARQQEEIKRSQAEVLRVEAEKERELSYEEIKKDNSTFKDNINSQYEDIITKNTEFKEQMNTDFGNAKTDYFGEEHLNVVDRLNSDFDNVHQRINDSSYLEYSGTNITADNSYYGLTKDMFIKGRLLQNLVSMSMSNVSNYSALSVESGYFKLQATGDWSMAYYMKSKTLLKPSTKYTILLEVKENTLNDGSFTLNQQQNTESCFNGQLGVIKSQITGVYKYVGTTSSDLDSCKYAMRTFLSTQATSGYILFRYMILEGDYTNTPISELPYFEGITSVGENEDNLVKIKSHNKNFFKLRDMPLKLSKGVTCTVDDDLNFTIKSDATSGSYPSVYVAYPKEMFEGKKFTLSCDVVNENPDIAVTVQVNYLKIDGTYSYIAFGGTKNTHTFPNTIQSDIVNIQMCVNNKSTTGVVNSMVVSNLMCEENTVKTEYVEYKESIQELLLDEPLRDLPNGTCDEILEDGTEIRRVGKLEIDTSLFIKVGTYNEGVYRWKYTHPSVNGNIKGHILSVRCDKLPTISANDTWGHMGYKDGIAQNSGNLIIIYLDAYNDGSELSKANMVKKLGTITVYYELAEPIITEHNKNINLKTFEGKTHITSDNYLLPTLSCKVPSNVQAVVMSLKEENQELNNTITEMSLESEEQNLSNIETNLDQDVRLTMLELGVM